jgi:hypothetical protein
MVVNRFLMNSEIDKLEAEMKEKMSGGPPAPAPAAGQ